MVAASIQLLASAAHGLRASPDRITASSQGGLMGAMDATPQEYVSKITADWARRVIENRWDRLAHRLVAREENVNVPSTR